MQDGQLLNSKFNSGVSSYADRDKADAARQHDTDLQQMYEQGKGPQDKPHFKSWQEKGDPQRDAQVKAREVLKRPWPGGAEKPAGAGGKQGEATTTTQSSGGSQPPGATATTNGGAAATGHATGTQIGTGEDHGKSGRTTTASSGGTTTPATESGTYTTNGVAAPSVGHGNTIPENTTRAEHIDLARKRAENLEEIARKRPLTAHERKIYDNARRVVDRNSPAAPGSRKTGNQDDLAMSGDEDALVPVTPGGEDATLDAESGTSPADAPAPRSDAIGSTINGPSVDDNPDAPTGNAATRSSSNPATAQAQPPTTSTTPGAATPGPPRGNPSPSTSGQHAPRAPGDQPNNTGADTPPQKSNKKNSDPKKSQETDKTAYSAVFEMHLDPKDYGTSDDVHFNRANEALHNAILADPEFGAMMEKLIPGVTERVSSKDGREKPDGYTWRHEDTPGLMRLVPTSQHTPGSTFWKALHPDSQGRGGYALWAVPAGAKKRKDKKKKK